MTRFDCVFLVRTFWENERPSSTDDETDIENEVPSINCETCIRNQSCIKQLKSENRRLQSKIQKLGSTKEKYEILTKCE